MIRLVHPAPAGNGTDPSARPKGARSSSLWFTPEEARHVTAALRAIARAHGGYRPLAETIGIPVETLYKAVGRRASGILVIRLAKAGGMTVDALLSGKLAEAGNCAMCGAKIAEGAR